MDTDIVALAAQNPTTLWLLAAGIFSPPVISVIQQSRWSARRQALVALAFYVLVAAVTVWLNGIFTTSNVFVAVVIVFLVGSAAYKAGWKPTGVASKIEQATPIGSGATPQQGRHEA